MLNPLSGRVRRQLATLRKVAMSLPGVSVREAANSAAMADAAAEWRADPPDLIVIMGGDGTLQGMLTALLQEPNDVIPDLLVIPAGTTNMTAADLGARYKPERALRLLAAWLDSGGRPPGATERAVLRIEAGPACKQQFGMFFGTGAILNGVRYYHQQIRPSGVHGVVGPVLAFGRMLLSLLRNKPSPLLPPMPAALQMAGSCRDGDWLLVLASTLNRLLIGCRPYWGTEEAPLHVTAVAYGPGRLARVLPSLLSGRGAGTARERDGYFSHNLEALSLTGPTDFILDGESFPADGPIRIAVTRPLRFLSY
ncbi:diacylglycerol/lipid kinase family protein [Stutzerimonas stutzeri]|uniref:diacylglycerol/lipid kinase family protein n=1 Tax=Stutzerimonas stutzeri TaxID=316 RepID=UPI002109EB2D|nr:diacylglycerol kinase family protein [Stutzerimonas stutzeri]MCQ4319289.1 hypothetical protein [Stutzerimonas stutzeri]